MNSPGDPDLPQRRNPSPGVHIQSGAPNIVLLNINTEKRLPWLANQTAFQLLKATWSEATAWLVGDFILMPDHLHALCAPRELSVPIERWIAYWKREFRLRHRRPEWRFQSRGWHHRLRDGETCAAKWLYLQENPLRKGLVKHMDDWPFKGRVFDLTWTGE